MKFSSEEKMPISFSLIVLTSQLVIAVADNVPTFDIARGCRIDSTTGFALDVGMNENIKRCVNDEQQAKGQLETQWSGFANPDRVMCTESTTNDNSTPPSYVELLTCLQDQQLARKLPKD